MLVSGDAPVPPSWPEISTTSACALATPAATVPDADLGDELHVNPRVAIRVLQVVDELRQVLDRVDVVVRRRRNQRHAGRRVPHLGDPRIHLEAGQLTALAGLGALRHLDLEIARVDEVLARHAEARRGDLLDGAASRVAVGDPAGSESGSSPPSPLFDLPPSRFIAIASVSCASWLIDPYDIAPVANRLTMASTGSTSSIGTGVVRPSELEQPAQRAEAAALIVHDARVVAVDRVLAAPRGVLELEDRLGIEQVELAVAAPLVLAARIEIRRRRRPAAP